MYIARVATGFCGHGQAQVGTLVAKAGSAALGDV